MKVKLFILSLALLLVSCGSFKSQTQVDNYSYLQIVGEVDGEELSIDGRGGIVLGDTTESFDLNGKTVTKIRVEKGKHTMKISRNGKLIVNRVFYVSEGNIFEVELP